jgi:hypothetical protein
LILARSPKKPRAEARGSPGSRRGLPGGQARRCARIKCDPYYALRRLCGRRRLPAMTYSISATTTAPRRPEHVDGRPLWHGLPPA